MATDSGFVMCDVCSIPTDSTEYLYCRACMQKLCSVCINIHRFTTASKDHTCEPCMNETEGLELAFVKAMADTFGSLYAAAKWTQSELGIPVSINYKQNTMQLSGNSYEVIKLAIETLQYTVFEDANIDKASDFNKLLKHGYVEWIFRNTTSAIVKNLYKGETDKLQSLFKSVTVEPFYRGSTPQRSTGLTPQNALNKKHNEIARYKDRHTKRKVTNINNATIATSSEAFRSHFTGKNTDDIDNYKENSQHLKSNSEKMNEINDEFDKNAIEPLKHDANSMGPVQNINNGNANHQDQIFQPFIIRCNLDDYEGVKDIIDDIVRSIQNVYKTAVTRPEKDAFRVNLYKMIKESSPDVLCTSEQLQSGVTKLIIWGKTRNDAIETKREFLSLYCKECSVCETESTRPTYLECKHLLCHTCVQKSTCLNNGLLCQVCDDTRRSTPVSSLQVHCLDSLNESGFAGEGHEQIVDERDIELTVSVKHGKSIVTDAEEGSYAMSGNVKEDVRVPKLAIVRKPRKTMPAGSKTRLSVRVPKYVLQKWSKRTGGLMKLKSVVENELGFETIGPLDSLVIVGKDRELLDLAVYSLETQNDPGAEHGVRRRLINKAVEWRFKGDFAKVVNNLFNSELHDLTRKHKTVSLSVFTRYNPATVDIKCAYAEYHTVNYDIDELENQIKCLHEDEYIQPKTFYYNVKVNDFVYSKENNEHVFCTLSERKNLNVITLKARKRERIADAKDELSNW